MRKTREANIDPSETMREDEISPDGDLGVDLDERVRRIERGRVTTQRLAPRYPAARIGAAMGAGGGSVQQVEVDFQST